MRDQRLINTADPFSTFSGSVVTDLLPRYKNVIDTASVKLLVGPGLVSRYHAWKFQVWPAITETAPVGVGVFVRSSCRLPEPSGPLSKMLLV